MSNWNLSPSGYTETFGYDSAAYPMPKVITASSTAHAKGSWTEIASSLRRDVAGFWLYLGGYNSGNQGSLLVDIGVGTAGSEIVIVSNIMRDATTGSYREGSIGYIPIAVAKGSRVAARVQSTQSSGEIGFQLRVQYAGNWADDSLQHATTYGDNEADSGGVAVTPSSTVNTKGAWHEITPATARDHEALMLCPADGADITRALQSQLIDIGFGASGSEVVAISNIAISMGATGNEVCPKTIGALSIHIKQGTRMAIRTQTSSYSSSTTDFVVVGFS